MLTPQRPKGLNSRAYSVKTDELVQMKEHLGEASRRATHSHLLIEISEVYTAWTAESQIPYTEQVKAKITEITAIVEKAASTPKGQRGSYTPHQSSHSAMVARNERAKSTKVITTNAVTDRQLEEDTIQHAVDTQQHSEDGLLPKFLSFYSFCLIYLMQPLHLYKLFYNQSCY